ncbi:MAG: chemotaxis response regulator protein-glutamate methylesterase [Terracidiphilus sp.]
MRVLVADDAVLFRRLLADVLATFPGVEVVGSAANGRIAIRKVRDLKPDLLTLDIEMPEMDGLAVLDALLASTGSNHGAKVEVIVVSALSRRGGDLTMRALEKGAFDFITKPEAASAEQSREALLRELAPRIRAVAHRLEVRAILGGNSSPSRRDVPARSVAAEPAPAEPSLDGIATRMQRLSNPSRPELVLVGVSTGGPVALARLLPAIPSNIGVPILIVQHMPPIFTKSLADSLDSKCTVRVREAVHGELPEPNTVYIAPGARQMRLGTGPENRPVIELTDDPPENNCKPAVDYLFRSAANRFPGRAMAVILTGMGSDGTLGLRLLKRHGCFVIAQDEASCVIYGMPKSAVDAGVADAVLPLDSIADRIVAAVKGGRS